MRRRKKKRKDMNFIRYILKLFRNFAKTKINYYGKNKVENKTDLPGLVYRTGRDETQGLHLRPTR